MATIIPVFQEKALEVGEDITYVPADPTGHLVAVSSGNVSLYIFNGSASTVNITAPARTGARNPQDGSAFADIVIPCRAAGLTITPSFERYRFMALDSGFMSFTLSVTTDIQVSAVSRDRYTYLD